MGTILFYPVNDQRTTAIKKGYTLRPLRLSTIDEHELARHVEADSGIDHARVEYIMASVVKQLREMVLNGHKVELSELGTIGLTVGLPSDLLVGTAPTATVAVKSKRMNRSLTR